MRLNVTKMHGAGNDFVVLDATKSPLNLSAAQFRWLADRHMGVGADQILIVGPSPAPGVDFSYRIVNADGGEVQHCGNGARCFVRFVRMRGLTDQTTIRVRTINADLVLTENPNGQVTVNMGQPRFEARTLPFDPSGLAHQRVGEQDCYELPLDAKNMAWQHVLMKNQHLVAESIGPGATVTIATASVGNPHAVVLVNDVNTELVDWCGPWVRSHPAFAQQVNVGFMQIVSPNLVKLRVYERGVGETLACGTGACAAVACGIRMGLLTRDRAVNVQATGGTLSVHWPTDHAPLMMTGPATPVFETTVDLPDC